MNSESRAERLQHDFETLQSLAADSPVLEVEAFGAPPDRYLLTLHGQGIARVDSPSGKIEWSDEHRIELRMPFLYPDHAPDIRWETSLFHPNLSFSGFLSLEDVGLPWSAQVGIDVVCERLWDVARLAFVDLEHAINPSAKRWIQDHESDERLVIPVDPRPLRKINLPGSRSNVVRYHRRGAENVISEAESTNELVAGDGVMVINEQTVAPRWPQKSQPPRPSEADSEAPAEANSDDGDEVFYIGD